MEGPPSPLQLIEAWDPDRRRGDHVRLAALLSAAGRAPDLDEDTLGQRHRRLLLLHKGLVDRPMEATVACGHCGTRSEFVVPAQAILAEPPPAPGATVEIRAGRQRLTFRLPRMSDLAAVAGLDDPEAMRGAVARRCLVGEGDVPVDRLEALGERWEALDPAASVVLNIDCAGCGQAIAASVDLAGFVARDLDRLVDGLLRDIDTIASAYGWSEAVILALPPARRARYVALIANARSPARPALTEGWA